MWERRQWPSHKVPRTSSLVLTQTSGASIHCAHPQVLQMPPDGTPLANDSGVRIRTGSHPFGRTDSPSPQMFLPFVPPMRTCLMASQQHAFILLVINYSLEHQSLSMHSSNHFHAILQKPHDPRGSMPPLFTLVLLSSINDQWLSSVSTAPIDSRACTPYRLPILPLTHVANRDAAAISEIYPRRLTINSCEAIISRLLALG